MIHEIQNDFFMDQRAKDGDIFRANVVKEGRHSYVQMRGGGDENQ
jgi:hypothetical protein